MTSFFAIEKARENERVIVVLFFILLWYFPKKVLNKILRNRKV